MSSQMVFTENGMLISEMREYNRKPGAKRGNTGCFRNMFDSCQGELSGDVNGKCGEVQSSSYENAPVFHFNFR